MLFECPSKPNGDFFILAPEDSTRTYVHIVKVLLDAANGTPIDVLLRGEGITNLLKLRQYIRKPGLPAHGFTWTDPIRGNEMHLSPDQCEDLLAIESYINWLYNKIDLDIADKTREDFEGFVMWIYDDKKPINLRHDFDLLLRATQDCSGLPIAHTKHKALTPREMRRNCPPDSPTSQRLHAHLMSAFDVTTTTASRLIFDPADAEPPMDDGEMSDDDEDHPSTVSSTSELRPTVLTTDGETLMPTDGETQDKYFADIHDTNDQKITKDIPAYVEMDDDYDHLAIPTNKTAYGIRTSALQHNKKITEILTALGFAPSPTHPTRYEYLNAGPTMWTRTCGDHHEYIAIYGDDFTITARDPESIMDILKNMCNLRVHATISTTKAQPFKPNVATTAYKNETGDQMRKQDTLKAISDRDQAKDGDRTFLTTRSFAIDNQGYASGTSKPTMVFVPEDDPW